MPEIVPCPACRRDVSNTARQCPHCGHAVASPRRGCLGVGALAAFWGWQALMALWIFTGLSAVAPDVTGAAPGREQDAMALAVAVGLGLQGAVWLGGTLATGLMVLMTRPR